MHCFITGITSGIGLALARAAHEQGWQVSGCGRRQDKLDQAQSELAGASLHRADVGEREQLATALTFAAEAHGPIDALVANAGHGMDGEISDLSIEDFEAVFRTNVFGVHATWLTGRAHLAAAGRFVIVASVASWLPIPRMGAYCASKAAIDSYAAALRMEVADQGIRVCTCHPGTVRTAFFDSAPKPGQVWSWRPGKSLSPEAVARAILRQCEHGGPRRRTLPWFARLTAALYRTWSAPVEGIMRKKLQGMRQEEHADETEKGRG